VINRFFMPMRHPLGKGPGGKLGPPPDCAAAAGTGTIRRRRSGPGWIGVCSRMRPEC